MELESSLVIESDVEIWRGVWSGVLSWSLECSFGVESGMEFWCGVWRGVLLWSLVYIFRVVL